jgi:hypothetical protein
MQGQDSLQLLQGAALCFGHPLPYKDQLQHHHPCEEEEHGSTA